MSAVVVKLRVLKSKSFAGYLRFYRTDKQTDSVKHTKFETGHSYIQLYPWKSRDEFVDTIEKSIIYNQDGLIAINKPFGVPINVPGSTNQADNKPKVVIQTMSSYGISECKYSMAEILPMLKARLNLKSLSIVKSPERYTSGIILLATSEKSKNAISIAFKRSLTKQLPAFKYWALTTFIPQAHEKLQRVGIRLVEVKEFDEKVPIIETRVSKLAVKTNALSPVLVKMKILTVNNIFNTALVELETSKTTMHFLRVYMAHKLAPILGDGMYSARVKSVLGKPVIVSPFNRAAYQTGLLSERLSLQLHVPQNKTESIPTHLHLHQVTLSGYANKQDLILNSSPPEYFMWSLDRLDLELEPQVQLETVISK